MAADESDVQIDELVRWFRKKGGWLHPNVDIVHNESHGFHMRAAEALLSSFRSEERRVGKECPV